MDGTAHGCVYKLGAKKEHYYSWTIQKNWFDLDVSKNNGTPKSSILIGFTIINHPFWGTTFFGNIHLLPVDTSCIRPRPQKTLGGMLKASDQAQFEQEFTLKTTRNP